MWCSKMAARWRWKDGNLNAGKGDFLVGNIPDEFAFRHHGVDGVDMDTQSVMDHSILAIFEDSAVTSEDKSEVEEEESENLLSALTEMLDSVEDVNGALSPFDTLPNSNLLSHLERRDDSVELSLAERLRPKSKSTNVTCAVNIERDEEDKTERGRTSPQKMFKHQSESLFCSQNRKAEPEVEVFTSSSLVNLVKIMHSYCLKLHVEEDEGEALRRNHTLFSQGEVWKYERPSEESDEEINVVSDDEVNVKETKTKEEGNDGKLLKSVLLNGKSSKAPLSREKKRVSFGPVQVASFDELEDKERLNEKNLSSQIVSKALENPTGSPLESQTPTSDISCNKTEVSTRRGETKAKSLSLQQYRQLRRKRQPLVEKQGNYTTKWPSLPEPPKELTPILCLQGQVQISCGPKAANRYPEVVSKSADLLCRSPAPVHKTQHTPAPTRPPPSEGKPSSCPQRSRLKRQRNGSRVASHASPKQRVTTNTSVHVPASKISPVKKGAPLSVDPPNPVLLPMPASQTPSPSTLQSSSEVKAKLLSSDSNLLLSSVHLQETQKESSGTSLQQKPLKPEVSGQHTESTHKWETTTAVTEPKISPPVSPMQTSIDEPAPSAEVLLSEASPEDLSPLQFGGRAQSSTDDSGIEAADMTSLLEQFEETQAKERREEPKLENATSPSNQHIDGHLDKSGWSSLTAPVETHQHSSTSSGSQRDPQQLQMLESVEIPEPLGTDIILSTEPARRRHPPSKAIQIIDPRPLPPKKTHASLPEFPAAHILSYISSDHDYCGSVDRSLSNPTQDSSPAAGCKNQTSTGGPDATTRAVSSSAKSVLQDPPEESRTRSETNLPSVKTFSEVPAEKESCSTPEYKTPQCSLPTPPPSPVVRGREKRRYQRRSPRSSSSSSSCSSSSSSSSSSSTSRSPKRQKCRHKRSESSSSSSSRSRSISHSPPRRHRWSYKRTKRSRSRSSSWSRSRSPLRSRSPSPQICHRKWRDVYSSRESRRLRREHEIRIQKLKAIDERRVVYVGRICRSMTHDELRERFSQFGDVECVSLHFRERGDHYAFVTFYNMEDAFAAIDNGGKLRKPDELPFDICFGGRRQFCNSDYADLDANRDPDRSPVKSRYEDLDFDSLLKQAQKGLKR
ncbi:peroxisome proliferator-activated receptor gamma coactivator-related protein 1 isoform X1 [Xyrichtys novacula]|uniref:Peroxisome proliferator-activated receptor gamma coactivator-related protein 1 isoform X1 n=1 Tax=Xyrichtys novacula TaxID=13765 RepID=A0AAV1EYI9_XYRNO|nr:peroxisome proliferator-activated receptor gamma coactivator-related protein 1 isoform X1 [Xyrichtys novacula]